MFKHTTLFAAVAGLVLAMAGTAQADLTWDNGAGTMYWNTTDANWGGLWTNGNKAQFTGSGTGIITIDKADISVTDRMTFTANGYEIAADSTYTLGISYGVLVNAGVTATISAPIINTSSFNKLNPGTLILSGLSTYNKENRIVGGVLAASIMADGGQPSSIGKYDSPNALSIWSGATFRYIGPAVNTNRLFNLRTGGADPCTIDASGTGPINFTGTGSISVPAGAVVLVLTGTNTGDNIMGPKLVENSAIKNLSLTKDGDGKWILTNANTYTGATTVNEGTLLVNGSLAAGSAVTVNGGTLGGTGALGGAVTINAGGTLAPGASIGTLTVGNTTINGTFSVDVDNLGASDLLAVTGNLILGGSSILSIVDIDQLVGSYTIATYTGTLTGTFAGGNNLPVPTWWVDYGTGSNSAITMMPEPATLALLALGGLGMILSRKRK